MAKITLFNTRPHDITLHMSVKDQVTSVTIPAAKEDPEDRSKITPGKAEADADMVANLAKSSKVVKHYFDSGMLKKDGGKQDETKDAQ